jgi:hypothetical protein
LQDLKVPADIYNKLKAAADNHSITELRQQITLLEEMDGMQPLVQRLRELLQKFDLAGVKDVLDALRP